MSSYTISDKAYTKIAFHAAKYPHRRVNGILIGKEESGQVECIDAIPLLHHWTSLSPSMEIGLDLARSYALSLGLDLVGYYQASEYLNDTAIVPVGEKVAETIRRTFPSAVVFVVDSSKLGLGEPALIPYLPQGLSWRRISHPEEEPFSAGTRFKLANSIITSRVLTQIRQSKLHQKLGDFDDHLEDVSIDWLRNVDCYVEP